MTRRKLQRAEIIDLGSSSFRRKRAVDVRSFVERRAFKHRKTTSIPKFQQPRKNQEHRILEMIPTLDTSIDEEFSIKSNLPS